MHWSESQYDIDMYLNGIYIFHIQLSILQLLLNLFFLSVIHHPSHHYEAMSDVLLAVTIDAGILVICSRRHSICWWYFSNHEQLQS